VPASALDLLAAGMVVSPAGASVAVAQDRIVEKAFVRGCGTPVAPYAEIRDAADLRAADPGLFPGVLKAARLGYDGKGQARVADVHEALAAFDRFGGVPCVLERRLDLAMEVSVVVARGFDGLQLAYPVSENVHRDGILALSTVPARVRRTSPAGDRRRAEDRAGDGLRRRALRRVLRAVRRLAGGQRDGAQAAQLRPLLDRRLRQQPVRAAGAGDGRTAAGVGAPARPGGDDQPARRHLVRGRAGAHPRRAKLAAVLRRRRPSCTCTARPRPGAAARWAT
jgi:hypothetical protein